jgi:predicted MFS family arabinose efflux permease
MPFAVRDLHATSWYALTFGGYLTASIVALIFSGERSDATGPLVPFAAGLASFVAGLLISAAAPGIALFIAGRALAGFGAGLIIVPLYVIAARSYAPDVQPRILAAMASAWVIPSIAGPALAGLIVQLAGWRYVFYCVPPLAVPAAALVLPRLIRHRHEAAGGPAGRARSRMHWAALAATGLALGQYAAQDFSKRGAIIGGIAVGLLALSLPRLLPRGTLAARRGLPALILMRGVLAGAFFGTEAFIPLMLVAQRHLSAGLAGLALTGASTSWAVGSWVQARARRDASRARLIAIGATLLAGGIAAVALAALPTVSPAFADAGWVIAGLGMGLGLTSVNVETLRLSVSHDQGVNSAALQLSDVLGSAICIAVAGATLSGLRSQLGMYAFLPAFGTTCAVALLGITLSARTRPERACQ